MTNSYRNPQQNPRKIIIIIIASTQFLKKSKRNFSKYCRIFFEKLLQNFINIFQKDLEVPGIIANKTIG